MAAMNTDEHDTEARSIRISIDAMRDAAGAALPAATAGAGQFAVVDAGWGTGGRYLEGEAASGNTKTGTLSFDVPIPIDFEAAGYSGVTKSLKIKVKARLSAIANTGATLDAAAFISDGEGGVSGGDQVATAAQAHNSDTWTEFEFTITPTNIEPGSLLHVFIRYIVDDSGGTTGSKAQIGAVSIDYNGRG